VIDNLVTKNFMKKAFTLTINILKLLIDILSFICVFLVFVIFPIWLILVGIDYRTNVKLQIAKLMFITCIPCILGLRWLSIRYSSVIARKYPITSDFRFRIAIVLIVPITVMFIFIVKTLWNS